MLKKAVFLVACFFLFSSLQNVWAADKYIFILEKQEQKKKTRWSLQDWLEQRDRMVMMDIWLAMNSPTPYEFFVGGGYTFGSQNPGLGSYTGYDLRAAAFVKIFGLEAQREASFDERWLGIFHMRIFGFHEQATNITLQGGIKSQGKNGDTYRNGFAGARLSLYILHSLGIEGLFRYYFSSSPAAVSGLKTYGMRFEGTSFLDFSFFRVFGSVYHEPTTIDLGSSKSDVSTTGLTLGVKLFF